MCVLVSQIWYTESDTRARYYVAQIIDAVDFMHKKGVIHRYVSRPSYCGIADADTLRCRDLKPENMLLDDAFRIKITDFGTAKILDSDSETSNVASRELCINHIDSRC